MSISSGYIIDSNCFVTPHRTFCPTDVGVSFWNKLQALAEEGKICSIDKVKNELYANSDDLKEWTVVSMERSAPNSPGEIKLPDVCREHNVRCIQIEEMFREMQETY